MCRSLISKRYQSASNVAVEPNLSIISAHIKGDIIDKLELIRPETHKVIPVYQVLDTDGNIKNKDNIPDVSKHNWMIKIISYLDLFEPLNLILGGK
jgi:hypothetical protein